MDSLIFAIGKHAPQAAYFHSFVLWGSYRHEGQVEFVTKLKKVDY